MELKPIGFKGGHHCFQRGSLTIRLTEADIEVICKHGAMLNKQYQNRMKQTSGEQNTETQSSK